MVEGVHFDLRWKRPELLGARSLAVNLSDIAAMGGRPTACVVNLAVRDGVSAPTLDRIYAGLKSSARESGVDIVGGNITRARDLSITIALLGETVGAAMRRDTARPDDEIFVTGTLGDAALGWRVLSGEIAARGKTRGYLLDRFFQPPNRVRAGQRIAGIKPTPTAIDLSDGLLQDLGHILERSGVGATIDAASIPVSPAYIAVMGKDLVHAFSGGEDYELLFCLRPGHRESELTRRLQ
ncbi:MAG: thiamine-monophosphate kinase, partial [Candidatus Binataceae bacterium]|nr:thiamine-monophosphate kinase [Candidatus Binataceae bacterium]